MKRAIPLLLLGLLLLACTSQATPTPTRELVVNTAVPTVPPTLTTQPTLTERAATTEPAASATATPALPASATPTASPVPTADPAAVTVAVEPILSGFERPVEIVWAGDQTERYYVVDQVGLIWVIEGGERLATPLLDLRGAVSGANEQGLLGLAFEPDRPERFYVNYTDLDGTTRIVRYRTGDGLTADRGSGEVILSVNQPAANHNGGNLEFGPDGYLWIGLGDGGGAGDRYGQAQRPDTLLGAMLRIDVSGESGYTIPADNPFRDGAGGAPEVWAIGLRNPWRYSFDRETGELWIADVGQNQIEEVNRVPSDSPALNYGWPIMEGQQCYDAASCDSSGFVAPTTQYTHAEGGCSITGGYVYRGEQFPALRGLYFFSDFCSGKLWAIPSGVESPVSPTLVLATGLPVAAFGESPTGELYLAAFDGSIYQLAGR